MTLRRHSRRKMGQPFSEEYFPYVKPFRILMVGLCGSGKTSLLYRDGKKAGPRLRDPVACGRVHAT